MTPSSPSCATRTRELATLAVSSSKRKEESDGQMWSRRLRGWDEKDGRWKIRDHNVTSWLRLAVMCGAAGVEREEPSSVRSLANGVSGIQELKNMLEAFVCCRLVFTPKRITFLERRNRCKHGQGGGKATKGTTVTGLGWLSSGKGVAGSPGV